MDAPAPDLKTQIAARIAATPDGVWTPVDFLDLGRREAVDKALQRLVAAALLRRVERGLYDRPHLNPLTKKPSVPDYRRIIDAIARRDQVRMVVDGMTAANDLGLSDAVPGQIVVHIDGRLRPIRIGNQTITFRLTSASKLYWAGRPAMRVVQALHWLRDALNKPDDRARIVKRLQAILHREGQGAAITADLREGLVTLPGWMQDLVRSLLDEVGEDNRGDHTAGPAADHDDHQRGSRRRRTAARSVTGGGDDGDDRQPDNHRRRAAPRARRKSSSRQVRR